MKSTPVVAILFLLSGCASSLRQTDGPSAEVFQKWNKQGDYYALLEIVDAHIDPFNHKATKADVLKYLGKGCDTEDAYPNAGPGMWVYPSSRRVPYGSYLVIEFDENDNVKSIEWVSE